jgi:hypothetical protein
MHLDLQVEEEDHEQLEQEVQEQEEQQWEDQKQVEEQPKIMSSNLSK